MLTKYDVVLRSENLSLFVKNFLLWKKQEADSYQSWMCMSAKFTRRAWLSSAGLIEGYRWPSASWINFSLWISADGATTSSPSPWLFGQPPLVASFPPTFWPGCWGLSFISALSHPCFISNSTEKCPCFLELGYNYITEITASVEMSRRHPQPGFY